MCILKCIDCPHCPGLLLTPLRKNFFGYKRDGSFETKPRPFLQWDILDSELWYRYLNNEGIYIVVYDHICKNKNCLRRDPDFQPDRNRKETEACGAPGCDMTSCRMAASRIEDYCVLHHPSLFRYRKLTPEFRVRLQDDYDYEVNGQLLTLDVMRYRDKHPDSDSD
jgi:hypothetical protein